ncbi:putative NLI interacting factor like phosphatase [Trypanosoma vivax]|nr:hypothetical protein TRVL_05232 [Trypanosoma vivax]KAH8613847.1 putative NLI interacting factor like phosphatase [Trypanosoma vivax]
MELETSCNIRTERFEVDQYVRVQLSNGRSEIGVVIAIDDVNETAVIATRHGYDITVRLSSVRRAFLLVLDLNGVLVARGRGSFVDRPGVDEFVRFVMANFVVAVWTSGLERTSVPIIDKVLDGYQDRLLFRLYRDACTPCPTADKPHHTIKNLQRIFDMYPKSFNAVNTIIVDDSPDKCSHPDIALCPPSFSDPEKQMDDKGLEMAMTVLKEVLQLDRHSPLIRASQERLISLAAKEAEEAKKRETEEKTAKKTSSRRRHKNRNRQSGANEQNDGEKAGSRISVHERQVDAPAGLSSESWPPRSQVGIDRVYDGCYFSQAMGNNRTLCSQGGSYPQANTNRRSNDPHDVEQHTPPKPASSGMLDVLGTSSVVPFFSTNPDLQKRPLGQQHVGDPNLSFYPSGDKMTSNLHELLLLRFPQSESVCENRQNVDDWKSAKGKSIAKPQKDAERVSLPAKKLSHMEAGGGSASASSSLPSASSNIKPLHFTSDGCDDRALLRQLQQFVFCSFTGSNTDDNDSSHDRGGVDKRNKSGRGRRKQH